MDEILFEIKNNVAYITLNRPKKHNALNTEILVQLNQILDDLEENQDVRAIQLKGNGPSFCAGGDINNMISRLGKAHVTKERLEKLLHSIQVKMQRLKIPSLATIHGNCYGAGLVLATACDIMISSNDAKFGFAYGNIGLVSEASYFLVRYLGLQRAKYLVFGRKVIDAKEAKRIGLVLETFSHDELMNAADSILDEWTSGPKSTIGLSKQLLNAAMDNHFEEQLRLESAYQGVAFTTPEHKEGVDAFLEKRKVNFSEL